MLDGGIVGNFTSAKHAASRLECALAFLLVPVIERCELDNCIMRVRYKLCRAALTEFLAVVDEQEAVLSWYEEWPA